MKAKRCAICQQSVLALSEEKVSWPVPDQLWELICIDHAGPDEGKMLFAVVDVKTKWLEVIPVPSINSKATIKSFAEFIPPFLLTEKAIKL